ncbi:MAG: tRNA (adenosine(37)-N6)-threonylcarbamoyltransferase complex dimerization subunit type 1 TsaB [Heliobacteriaceae bacterium]|nr:tRNA (adenosine(37)-N6)-threonylcarbamoyltransferase complex dimerization subunit type 1 TsaB [Heliobacteriaceae bacterium]
MYIFGLDCATKVTALGIVDAHQVVAETLLQIEKPHSERLIPLVEGLFKGAGLTLNDLGGLAVTCGPGSFTGLRIGLATIKGMAHSLGIPVAGIPTLDALAWSAWLHRGLVCPLLDARKAEVYTCLYQGDGQVMKRLTPYQAVAPEKLVAGLQERLAWSPAPVLFLGDGVSRYQALLAKLGSLAVFARPEDRYSRGSVVARLGWEKISRGAADGLHNLVPLYLRASEAEVNWVRKHGALSEEA